MCHLALVYLSTIFMGARPLILKELIVPQQVAAGSAATLTCSLELGGSKLNYLKWYKDENEFCRFAPQSFPNVQKFSVPGLHTKGILCENSTVKFDPVSLDASGTYKCEASAQPRQTVMSSRNMSVIVYPTTEPIISGVMPDYREGEFIKANCTASPSNPPPKLTWFINGMLADKYMVHEYTEAVDPEGLYKRALGLKLIAKEDLFSGPGSSVYLVCLVSLPGFPPWRAIASPKMVQTPSPTLASIQMENSTDFQLNYTAYNITVPQNEGVSNVVGIFLWQNLLITVGSKLWIGL